MPRDRPPNPAPKVLLPIGDATEVVDTLYPFFRLQEEVFQVVVAGPEARMYHMVTHEVPTSWPSSAHARQPKR